MDLSGAAHDVKGVRPTCETPPVSKRVNVSTDTATATDDSTSISLYIPGRTYTEDISSDAQIVSVNSPFSGKGLQEQAADAKLLSVLRTMCTAEFFQPCKVHAIYKKSVHNFFVLEENWSGNRVCCRYAAVVQGSAERGRRNCPAVIQIRRYMHRNVVLMEDLASIFDCKGIQTYYINQKRAILLEPKEQNAGSTSAFENCCITCQVPLRPDCTFCSLVCHIDAPNHSQTGIVRHPSKKLKRSWPKKEKSTQVVGRPSSRTWSRKPEHPQRSFE